MSGQHQQQSSDKTTGVIAFQGELGAYSHMACQRRYSAYRVLPCPSFDEALEAVISARADLAMIPIENSTAGRVADIHMLLPDSGLYIIGEQFEAIRHCLLALPASTDAQLTGVISHVQALGQCHQALKARGLQPQAFADTAGAAKYLAETRTPHMAAIASKLAAEVYGLRIVQENLQDMSNNTTRFVTLSRRPLDTASLSGPVMTSMLFRVRNVPAALFKALGGFATNGVNLTKLESYYDSDSFTATEFYAEFDGSPHSPSAKLALEELAFFTSDLKILGCYPQARRRQQPASSEA